MHGSNFCLAVSFIKIQFGSSMSSMGSEFHGVTPLTHCRATFIPLPCILQFPPQSNHRADSINIHRPQNKPITNAYGIRIPSPCPRINPTNGHHVNSRTTHSPHPQSSDHANRLHHGLSDLLFEAHQFLHAQMDHARNNLLPPHNHR